MEKQEPSTSEGKKERRKDLGINLEKIKIKPQMQNKKRFHDLGY